MVPAKMAEIDSAKDLDERRLRQAMTECRFAFMQALEAWSGNDSAREGLDEVLTRMIHYEIGRRDVEGARGLLAELSREKPELAKKIDALALAVERENADASRLQAMARNTDIRVDTRPQLVILGALAIYAAAVFIFLNMFKATSETQYRIQFITLPISTLLLLMGLYFPLRKRVTTAISRRAFGLLLLFPTSLILHRGFALTQGDTTQSMLMTDLAGLAVLALAFAMTIMPAIAGAAGIFLMGAFAILHYPAHGVMIFLATCTVVTAFVALLWTQQSKKAKETASP